MFSAAPPTAAGVTSVTNEPATWASRVRKKSSRSPTNPESDNVAPTYVTADSASAAMPQSRFASCRTWPRLTYVWGDALVLAGALLLFYVAMVVFGRLAGNFAEEL